MGFVLGVNGVVTFKNCNLKDVLAKIPLGNIILETDSPYLTPVPFRGTPNSPVLIEHVYNFIAEVRDTTPEQLSELVDRNIKSLFHID